MSSHFNTWKTEYWQTSVLVLLGFSTSGTKLKFYRILLTNHLWISTILGKSVDLAPKKNKIYKQIHVYLPEKTLYRVVWVPHPSLSAIYKYIDNFYDCLLPWITMPSKLVFLTYSHLETRKRVIGKQCRSRSDATWRGVWSGSIVFAYRVFHQKTEKNRPDAPTMTNGLLQHTCITVEESTSV